MVEKISNIQMIDHTKIRIIVAESFDLVRYGLRSLFNNHTAISLVADTDCLQDLLKLTAQHKPNVILIDLQLGDGSYTEYISRLLDTSPHSKILISTRKINKDQYLQVYQLGVAGMIDKGSSCKLLLEAIYRVCEGQTRLDCHDHTSSLHPIQLNVNASPTMQDNVAQSFNAKLSNSERRIARLACKGISAKEISRQFSITERTVRNQLSVIYKKAGVKKQIELCLKAPFYNYFQ